MPPQSTQTLQGWPTDEQFSTQLPSWGQSTHKSQLSTKSFLIKSVGRMLRKSRWIARLLTVCFWFLAERSQVPSWTQKYNSKWAEVLMREFWNVRTSILDFSSSVVNSSFRIWVIFEPISSLNEFKKICLTMAFAQSHPTSQFSSWFQYLPRECLFF